MKIEESKQGAVVVIKPAGPLVDDACLELRNCLSGASQRSMGRYVVDFAAISFLDSAGLELLLDTTDALMKGGRLLKLCAVNDTVKEAMELTGISSHFEHYPDVNAAVRSFL